MKYNVLLVLAYLLSSAACRQPATPVETNPWSVLKITIENHEMVTINKTDDTSMVKFYNGGSIFEGRHELKVDSVKPYFTMTEKDSLYQLAEDIIAKPIKPKQKCSDFVGDLGLVVDYGDYKSQGSYRQSAEYSGVCNADSLSDKTLQLTKLLSRKIMPLIKK